jgi:hypothetical protein
MVAIFPQKWGTKRMFDGCIATDRELAIVSTTLIAPWILHFAREASWDLHQLSLISFPWIARAAAAQVALVSPPAASLVCLSTACTAPLIKNRFCAGLTFSGLFLASFRVWTYQTPATRRRFWVRYCSMFCILNLDELQRPTQSRLSLILRGVLSSAIPNLLIQGVRYIVFHSPITLSAVNSASKSVRFGTIMLRSAAVGLMLSLFLHAMDGSFAIVFSLVGLRPQVNQMVPFPQSLTITEFWGKRWNRWVSRTFREVVFQPLKPKAGAAAASFAVFCVSAVLHGAMGAPLKARKVHVVVVGSYFLANWAFVSMERWLKVDSWKSNLKKRLWTWSVLFLSSPLVGGPFLDLYHDE